MDDLTFRRQRYAQPHSQDPKLTEAEKQDPAKQAFSQEVQQLDKQIQQAVKVPLPDGLAERLLLQQSFVQHQQKRHKQRWLAIAASVTLLFSAGVWQGWLPATNGQLDLGEYALAHWHHEASVAWQQKPQVSLAQVNAKLASMNSKLTQALDKVYYADFCHFANKRGLHLVMQHQLGQVTLFILPQASGDKLPAQFGDPQLSGQSFEFAGHNLLVLGEQAQAVNAIKNQLQHSLARA